MHKSACGLGAEAVAEHPLFDMRWCSDQPMESWDRGTNHRSNAYSL